MSALPFSRTRLAFALALPLGAALPLPSSAQAATSPPAASASSPTTVLAPVFVTGNPLRSSEVAAPVSVLSGDELTLRRGSSLGETLASQPGVSSTWFGPNANRPVIRGLDGDRVRILSNAGGSVDASSLSFDHAVPIDPLIVERIEVLRGPGALMYGGSAVGGVVNTIDNRIPDEKIEAPGGAAELRVGGADRERGGALLLETGNGRFALHADAFGRQTSDLRVPRFTPVDNGSPLEPTTTVRNSASRASGGALGGSWTFANGYLGLSADTHDSRYGTVAEPDVTIRMQRDHVGLAGEWRDLGGPIRTLRTQLNRTRYEHREIEGDGAVGTVFDSTGTEARIEAEHAPIGRVRGVIGLQLESTDFSALGEEAFVPSTTTRRQGLFVLEESPWPLGTLNAGLRLEHARIGSAGDADPGDAHFGPAQERRFNLRSASLANVFKITPEWSFDATLSRTERAPTFYELYAEGVHVATGAFERGDPTLGAERGSNLDLALQWKRDTDSLRVGVFAARFSRFISLEASGATVDVPSDDGGTDSVPEYVFRSVRARLHGIEIEGKHRLLASPWTLDLSGKLDATRARNADTGEALPRVAPLRATLGLDAGLGP